MNIFSERLNGAHEKSAELRRAELLAFSPSGNERADLDRIMEITGEHTRPYVALENMKIGDYLMMFDNIRIKYTARREVTPPETEKLEEIVEFYRLKAAELLGR